MRYTFVYDAPTPSDELRHYGILGMKWGIRRTPEELGHKTGRSSKNPAQRRREVFENLKPGDKVPDEYSYSSYMGLREDIKFDSDAYNRAVANKTIPSGGVSVRMDGRGWELSPERQASELSFAKQVGAFMMDYTERMPDELLRYGSKAEIMKDYEKYLKDLAKY